MYGKGVVMSLVNSVSRAGLTVLASAALCVGVGEVAHASDAPTDCLLYTSDAADE